MRKKIKIHHPDYELDGLASKPKFFQKGVEVKTPKSYKPKIKFW